MDYRKNFVVDPEGRRGGDFQSIALRGRACGASAQARGTFGVVKTLFNDFGKMLEQNGTKILKFYLHISPEEQLER